MTVEMVRDISQEVMKTILLVSGPALLVSLCVGLIVSLFQAITQIQEFTLTFVPKIIAVFLSVFLLFPWLVRVMVAFTKMIIENIPFYIR
ncbi:MAG TPA: flagellar biosynthesis protein FliQ [Thermodesulfobacteriota bacterium]|jgi:flagellar biosynthetic protein FliQ|nr:flagellar biosynthesis protein FliQ [Thermodesulfobacteriota bacterium]